MSLKYNLITCPLSIHYLIMLQIFLLILHIFTQNKFFDHDWHDIDITRISTGLIIPNVLSTLHGEMTINWTTTFMQCHRQQIYRISL